jgi:hypothetical protein
MLVIKYRIPTLSSRHNTPSTDNVVGITCEKCLSIRAPRQAYALWLSALLANSLEFWLQLINLALLLQVEYNNAARSGSAEPVSVWRENKSVDLVASVQRVQVFRLVQVPKHSGSIFSTRSAQRSIRGDCDSVNVASVADVVSLKAAGGEFPDLEYC